MSRSVGRGHLRSGPPPGRNSSEVKETDPSPFGIIFDFDGVLVDSFLYNARHIVAILATYGVRITEDDLWHYRGYSLPQLVALFSRSSGRDLPYSAIEATLNHRHDEHRASLIERELPDGLTAFLGAARAAGVPLAIGSSNIPANIHGFLELAGIDDAFSVFITCDDTARHKPDPTPFLLAAERLGLAPERCVVIEDSETGIEAAHRARMLAVGFTGYLRSSNEPLLPHADLRIASFTELTVDRLRALIGD